MLLKMLKKDFQESFHLKKDIVPAIFAVAKKYRNYLF